MIERTIGAHRFLAAALSDSLVELNDFELTEAASADEFVEFFNSGMVGDSLEALEELPRYMSERALSSTVQQFKPMRDAALDDPEMKRTYAKLPPTS